MPSLFDHKHKFYVAKIKQKPIDSKLKFLLRLLKVRFFAASSPWYITPQTESFSLLVITKDQIPYFR